MMQKLLLLLFLFLLFSTISALFNDKNGCGEYKYRNNNTDKCESCHNTCRQCDGPYENQCTQCGSKYKKCNTTTAENYYCKLKDSECNIISLTTTEVTPSDDQNWGKIIVITVGVIVAIIALAVILIILIIKKPCCSRKKTILEDGNFEMEHMVDPKKTEKEKFTTADSELEWNREDLLDTGGFGNVYKGIYTDKKEGSQILVAIKEAKKPKSDEPSRELEIMEQIDEHPHIIKLITTRTSDNLILVFPRRKDNLSNFLEVTQEISIKQRIRYCHQITEGMKHLVSKQIVHCDLKASNILVVDENWVQICDFGRSRYFNDPKPTLGTITHTAIELLDPSTGARNSESTDIWSFGVTIWEIFNDTRQKPYANVSENLTAERLLAHLKKEKHLKTTHWSSKGKTRDLASIKTHMLNCWFRKADNRPNFQSLSDFFASKLPKT